MVKQKHDVGALLGEVLRSYWPLFSKRALTFTVNGPSVPVSASFDHDRVVQVLSNLLGNALKFTPAGGVVVLSAHSHRDHVEFEVRDNGLGIPAEALPRVFERFWQLDGHASRGLGLGLYICKQIIAAHGGEVGVQSVLGCGSTFRFTLPSS